MSPGKVVNLLQRYCIKGFLESEKSYYAYFRKRVLEIPGATWHIFERNGENRENKPAPSLHRVIEVAPSWKGWRQWSVIPRPSIMAPVSVEASRSLHPNIALSRGGKKRRGRGTGERWDATEGNKKIWSIHNVEKTHVNPRGNLSQFPSMLRIYQKCGN